MAKLRDEVRAEQIFAKEEEHSEEKNEEKNDDASKTQSGSQCEEDQSCKVDKIVSKSFFKIEDEVVWNTGERGWPWHICSVRKTI